jgi:7-cyano-7-deazaguanine reductase
MNDRTYLGKDTKYQFNNPDQVKLDLIPNPRVTNYTARFTVPEFTSLCPQTGQPDFAVMIIDYQPRDWLLESKALKLWMFSFRNHGAYHEDVTVGIGQRFYEEVKPFWVRIAGFFMPRGGIPIDVVWERGNQLVQAPVLDLNAVKPYLGRI